MSHSLILQGSVLEDNLRFRKSNAVDTVKATGDSDVEAEISPYGAQTSLPPWLRTQPSSVVNEIDKERSNMQNSLAQSSAYTVATTATATIETSTSKVNSVGEKGSHQSIGSSNDVTAGNNATLQPVGAQNRSQTLMTNGPLVPNTQPNSSFIRATGPSLTGGQSAIFSNTAAGLIGGNMAQDNNQQFNCAENGSQIQYGMKHL
jgi:hypothetical protein